MKQVYVMQNSEGLVKIGISNNPEQRRRGLVNASGFNVDLLYTSSMIGNADEIERSLHLEFANYRKKGEWFLVDSHKLVVKRVRACAANFGTFCKEYDPNNVDFDIEINGVEVYVNGVLVDMKDGLYKLNSVHDISRLNASKRPPEYLRNRSTFKSCQLKSNNGGKPENRGTYGSLTDLLSYMCWLSPKFLVKTINKTYLQS